MEVSVLNDRCNIKAVVVRVCHFSISCMVSGSLLLEEEVEEEESSELFAEVTGDHIVGTYEMLCVGAAVCRVCW